ncbi:thioredoxin H7-like [Tripterygium wilfordii]|uniref:Thioredoxin H7-like n=1 Tax=Tripterygium wilfordii TaxID=458696 RepID=A0A7J7BY54_TRIWF|nr:thioredoxin H7-like [Tripterygium wilfordii]KAF5726794.1 thioredoxin H7-like [Tripterygium wilfordii]
MGANLTTESTGNGFSHKKISSSTMVVPVHSLDLWKSYIAASKVNNKLLVIEFTATWCGPCRYMEPVMTEFAAKYSTDADFIKIDVDNLAVVAQQFETSVLPAVVLVKDGKEVDRVAGVKKDELQKKIEKHRK